MPNNIKNTPCVSVGMPVYNGASWIKLAIESILSQDYRDLELIISDNASTDATEDICQKIAATDPRVRYYHNSENLGVNVNYNRVAQLARGDYFKWASANDVCAPQFISVCVSVLNQRPDVVLCYPRTQLIIDNSGTMEPYVDGLHLQEASSTKRFERILNEVQLNNILNGVIRTRVLRQTGLMRLLYYPCDYVLLAELALRGKFFEVPEFLFFRRMTSESATKLMPDSVRNEYFVPGQSKMLFKEWKLVSTYFNVVRCAPIELGNKLSLYWFLARRIWWMHDVLARDLWQSFQVIFSSRK